MDVILEMTLTAPSPVAGTDRNWHWGDPIPPVGASGAGSCLLHSWFACQPPVLVHSHLHCNLELEWY